MESRRGCGYRFANMYCGINSQDGVALRRLEEGRNPYSDLEWRPEQAPSSVYYTAT